MPTITATDTRSVAGRSEPNVPTLIVAWHPDRARIGMRRAITGTLLLGRGGDALGPGTLDDDRISSSHAEIGMSRGRARILDRGSRNGTWVDGAELTESRVLDEGAVIKVGRVVLVYRTCPSVWALHLDGALRSIGPGMAGVLEQVGQVAPRDAPVLVRGPTGTGKELIARAIHDASGRTGPFLAINCAAVDENLLHSELFGHQRGAFSGAERSRIGLIEQAHRGTLLLDEIGEASPALQASLLRVLQEGEVRAVGSNHVVKVDTRFVAATHRDLEADCRAERFREDLLARLARFEIAIPPLRDRIEDAPLIGESFLSDTAGRPVRLHHATAHAMLLQGWPRNVRQLQSILDRALAKNPRAHEISANVTTADVSSGGPAPKSSTNARRERPDRDTLLTALRASDLNLKACAKAMGVGRSTLYRWMEHHGIDIAELRDA